MSPASISTGRAWQTSWRTARTLTHPPTSAACSLHPVYQGRCHRLDWCQTTPWTACKSHQIKIMDKKFLLSVHSLQTHFWTRRQWIDLHNRKQGHFSTAYANGMWNCYKLFFRSCSLFFKTHTHTGLHNQNCLNLPYLCLGDDVKAELSLSLQGEAILRPDHHILSTLQIILKHWCLLPILCHLNCPLKHRLSYVQCSVSQNRCGLLCKLFIVLKVCLTQCKFGVPVENMGHVQRPTEEYKLVLASFTLVLSI